MSKSLNPKNPYVLNEFYFANSSNRYIYQESAMYFFRRYNALSILVVGSILACFVFFLIAKKSPIGFKPYRKMLLLSALVDCWMIVQSALIQTRHRVAQNALMVTFTGFLPSLLGYSYYCPILLLQNNAALFETSIVPIQFYYRYYTLKNDKSPSVLRTFFWFLLSGSFCLLPAASTFEKFCLTITNPKALNYGPYWYPEVPIPPLIVWQFSPVPEPFYKTSVAPSLQTFYYMVTFIISIMTVIILRKKFSAVSVHETVKEVQRQLTKTLIALAIIPLFTLVIPKVIPNFFIYFKIETNYGIEILNAMPLWYPIVNLLTTIIFIEPYWKYCMQYNPFSKHFSWRTSVVVPNRA